MRSAKIMTISLPPQMSKEIQKLAQEEQRTISELIREAFRQYKMNRVSLFTMGFLYFPNL